MEDEMKQSDVLIIGAGPTGLVLALWLTELGVKVRIVDKTAEPGTTSRALAVQARTLELYRQLDLTDAVIKHGHKVPAVNLWVKGKPATRLSFERIGSDLTPYPFLHIFPQDQHERLLIEAGAAWGLRRAPNRIGKLHRRGRAGDCPPAGPRRSGRNLRGELHRGL
jgi:2-polyprenyl-6-methoxyphenol hydroxylase-like FAD-dependent oxidoreductase